MTRTTYGGRPPRRWSRRTFGLLAAVGLALVGVYVWAAVGPTVQGPAPETRLGIQADDPLGPQGRPVTLGQALQALGRCSCPTPPEGSGPGHRADIQGTWVDAGTGRQVGVLFSSGLELTYTPDPRSSQQYLQEVQVSIVGEDLAGGESGFRLIDLRGTRGLAKEADAYGPASISWIESGYLVALIGYGGEILEQLVALAESMPS